MNPQQHQHWIVQANEHWKEHQPRRYKTLQEAGTLAQALREAAEATSREMQALRDQGLDELTAWEMVREQHLFPPEEPDESPPPPASQGYLAHRDLMRGLGQVRMPGEPD